MGNVTTAADWCLSARLHRYSSVEKMHDLSPEYMSIMDRKVTEDDPGWSQSLCSICIIPFQLGAGCLKRKDISHNTSTRWSMASRNGKGLNFMFWRVCFANWYALTS